MRTGLYGRAWRAEAYAGAAAVEAQEPRTTTGRDTAGARYDHHGDLPPPYMTQTEYQAQYMNAALHSFGFSDRVVEYLAQADVNARQCAEIVVALDFHPNEWPNLFRNLGLTVGQANGLRELILEEVSVEWRHMMNAIDHIRDDSVVTVLDEDGEEITMFAWEEALRHLPSVED